jgi:hypothetical protein
MAKVYKICGIRQRQIRLTKLRKMFGERYDRVVIPPLGFALKDIVYIFPASYMRQIDELTIVEMDDLLNGNLKFFIIE